MKFDGEEVIVPFVKDVIGGVQEEVMSPNDSMAALSSAYSGNSMLAQTSMPRDESSEKSQPEMDCSGGGGGSGSSGNAGVVIDKETDLVVGKEISPPIEQ